MALIDDTERVVFRPWRSRTTQWLLDAMRLYSTRHIPEYTLCVDELDRRGLRGEELQTFQSVAAHAPFPRIAWLSTAAVAMRAVRSNTEGNHNVYLALLKNHPEGSQLGGYALYVGETALTPEQRFQNHRIGHHAAAAVHRYGVCLIPWLYKHINSFGRSEATELEQRVHGALFRVGVPMVGHVGPMVLT